MKYFRKPCPLVKLYAIIIILPFSSNSNFINRLSGRFPNNNDSTIISYFYKNYRSAQVTKAYSLLIKHKSSIISSNYYLEACLPMIKVCLHVNDLVFTLQILSALEKAKSSKYRHDYIEGLFLVGEYYLQKGEFQEAKNYYSKIIDLGLSASHF